MENATEGYLPNLTERFGDAITDPQWVGREARLTLDRSRLLELLAFVRDDAAIALTYPAALTAYDTGDDLLLVYRLVSIENGWGLLMHVPVPREDAVAPSCTGLFPGMEWHEREVYDMFGVRFEGHRNLKRILLPDDWEGHPFRKDYVSVPSGDPLRGPQPVDPVGPRK
jgi:NADH-quinone oxidoreductase subunit C